MAANTLNMSKVILTVSLFVLCVNGASIEDLENYVRSIMQCKEVSGLSLTLVKGDQTVYAGGFGYRDIATKSKLTGTTLLNVGSLSKAFTATLAADAVARDKIDWEEPIRNKFPKGFGLHDNIRTAKTSLKDLLSHRLGIPSFWGVSTAVMNLTLYEIAQRMTDFPVTYQFRQKFLYSNYGFLLAAATLERATGETWEHAIYNRIFKKLNMTGSRVSTSLTEADWLNTAFSYIVINNQQVQNAEKELLPIAKELNPAAGVFMNAEDAAKWLKFHLSGGKDSNGRQVIPLHALKAIYSPVMATSRAGLSRADYPVDNLSFAYSLGWFNGVYNGYPKTDHEGRYNGYSATLTFLPSAGVGVWLGLTGSRKGEGSHVRDTITMYALDMLLGETPWLNSTTACSFPAPWKQTTKASPRVTSDHVMTSDIVLDVNDYVGEYVHPAFGTFYVVKNNGQLKYQFGLLLKGNLHPASRDQFHQSLDQPLTFMMVYYPQNPHGFPVSFSRNALQQVVTVTIPYLEFRYPPVFTKH